MVDMTKADARVNVFVFVSAGRWLSLCASGSPISLLAGVAFSLKLFILNGEFGPANNIRFYEGSVGTHRHSHTEFTYPFQHEGRVAMPGYSSYLSVMNCFINNNVHRLLGNRVLRRNWICEEYRGPGMQSRSGD